MELTDHRLPSAGEADLNNAITIRTLDDPGPGGAHHCYVLSLGENCPALHVYVPFFKGPLGATDGYKGAIGNPNGFTIEAYLAICKHRLTCFQSGPYACPENAVAIQGINGALAALKLRTVKRITGGVKGKLEPLPGDKTAMDTISQGEDRECGRLRIKNGVLHIGDEGEPDVASVEVDVLTTSWKAWLLVESAVKKLKTPLTAVEIGFLGAIPTSGAGRNGFNEFQQVNASNAGIRPDGTQKV